MEDNNANRLILICEGGVHTVEYFIKNKVIPSVVVMTAKRFRELIPYLTTNDDILIVVNGLINFTMADIHALFGDVEEVADKVKKVTVISNVDLGSILSDYYLYYGDLFYGEVKKVQNKKAVSLKASDVKEGKNTKKAKKKDKKDASTEKEETTIVHTKKDGRKSTINEVMSGYGVYSNKVNITLHGFEKSEVQNHVEQDILVSKLLAVDLFN